MVGARAVLLRCERCRVSPAGLQRRDSHQPLPRGRQRRPRGSGWWGSGRCRSAGEMRCRSQRGNVMRGRACACVALAVRCWGGGMQKSHARHPAAHPDHDGLATVPPHERRAGKRRGRLWCSRGAGAGLGSLGLATAEGCDEKATSREAKRSRRETSGGSREALQQRRRGRTPTPPAAKWLADITPPYIG